MQSADLYLGGAELQKYAVVQAVFLCSISGDHCNTPEQNLARLVVSD